MPRISASHDKDQNLVQLGMAVRVRRAGQGLSQEALADAAEIDRSHMGKIERGERNVTFLNIARIAKALQCKPSDLLLDAGL
ncbi:helix-turn-helix domain-containing protein [Pseudomonas aeruginosa]|uniref:helix-turn-helix domain-containing protein n=2 Tax=Pseudomonas aeruginosa TaxID=287 RepID=UPI00066E0B0B|nr:helix-turn-helix transcriptional regulator [Pseudomonas aeruginosa]MBV5650876.1 helix-turn-helix domain-containing protein [Pseudomonas aeruginosa]MCD2821712.1 helix-turn-helix domain-containing protein [Pseudomonas aeruginosa]MCD2828072.1 helix-turn-helix domain-containing protein [Pseudomonas aeruginosa]MDY1175464.1 helix-turn-helix transcriptional regulator [Pseudomonas aeruginosa]MEA0989199.1 helix-turn-helix transcriptional regulator [Pseudomonas aeruginosa]